jgi:uncharacterized protein (TIGR00369 family)
MTASAALNDVSEMTGIDIMRGLRDRDLAPPGVVELLEMRFTEVEEGRAVFEIDSRPALGNPLGTVHGGVTATLLDSAMGCAVHSTLPAGVGFTTVDLNVTFLRAVPFDGRTIQAEGKVIHRGGRIVTAEGRVTDSRGKLVATATTTCMVLPRR